MRRKGLYCGMRLTSKYMWVTSNVDSDDGVNLCYLKLIVIFWESYLYLLKNADFVPLKLGISHSKKIFYIASMIALQK